MTFTARDKNPTVNKYWTYQQVFNRQVEADLIDIETELALLAGGTGANTALSNLTTTSINQSLIPQSSKTLGDVSNRWSGIWSTTANFSGDVLIDTTLFVADSSNNRIGINTTPSHTLHVVNSSILTGISALYVSGTFADPGTTSTETGIIFSFTTPSSSSTPLFRGLFLELKAGSTHNRSVNALSVSTDVANTAGSFTSITGNQAGRFTSTGTTTGFNMGAVGIAQNADNNLGIFGSTTTAKNSAKNMAVVGFSRNTGTSGIEIGGYFYLGTNTPTAFDSAALIANNGTTTTHIVRFQDGSTDVFTIADGGALIHTGSASISGNLTIDTDTLYVDSTNNRVGINTTPSHTLHVVNSSILTGISALYVSGTFADPGTTSTETGIIFSFTTPSSSSTPLFRGLFLELKAGSTHNRSVNALSVSTDVANTAGSFTSITGNQAGRFTSTGTTTGFNMGAVGIAQNADNNLGIFGSTTTAKNSAKNMAVVGFSRNTGTSGIEIGGYFYLGTNTPTAFDSAALIANNGTTTTHIVRFQDGSTDVFTIADGGALIHTGSASISGNLTIDTNTFYVDSTNNRVAILTTSTISLAHLTVGNGGAVATNSIIAINGGSTGQAALYLYQNSALKGIVGNASGTNSLITGTAVNDLAIRNTQGILFSTDNGVTAHFIINSSGNIALGNSFITGMRANVGNGGAGSGNEIIAINGSATGITATYYYQNGTVRGLFGLAGASNNLINGSVQGDFNIRNSQAILFSADAGVTNHVKLLSTGDFWVDTNVLYVSAVNNRVGINNASPSVALDVTGAYNQSFTGTTTNGFNITGDSVTTGTLACIISNASNTSARSILSVIQDHASATSAIAVSIQQDSSSNALFLDHNLAGSTIEIDADDNSVNAMYGLRMNIANAGAGLEYAFRFDGFEIVSAAVGGSQDKKIRVSIAGTDYFVPLYTT